MGLKKPSVGLSVPLQPKSALCTSPSGFSVGLGINLGGCLWVLEGACHPESMLCEPEQTLYRSDSVSFWAERTL